MNHIIHHLAINPQGMGKGHGMNKLLHSTLGFVPLLLDYWEEGENRAVRSLPLDYSLLLTSGGVQI
jgi:hypothetical protein